MLTLTTLIHLIAALACAFSVCVLWDCMRGLGEWLANHSE